MKVNEKRPAPNLADRIVRSAAGLSCSTFSGVAGIETELNDLHISRKQPQIVSNPKGVSKEYRQTPSHRRRRLSPTFRTPLASRSSRETEKDFELFAEGHCDGDGDYGASVRAEGFPASSLPIDTSESSWGGLDRNHSAITDEATEYPGTPMDALSTDTETIINIDFTNPSSVPLICNGAQRAEKRTGKQEQGFETLQQGMQDYSSLIRVKERQDIGSATYMIQQHTTVLQRLDLVGRHMQQAGNPQHRQTVPQTVRHLDDGRNTVWSSAHHSAPSNNLNDFQKSHRRTQQQHQAARDDDEERTDGPSFHCPYIECHQRLWSAAYMTSDAEERRCVHTDCEEVFVDVLEWKEHVTSAHHDLLELRHDTDAVLVGKDDAETDIELDSDLEELFAERSAKDGMFP